jgi:hypothetical protein
MARHTLKPAVPKSPRAQLLSPIDADDLVLTVGSGQGTRFLSANRLTLGLQPADDPETCDIATVSGDVITLVTRGPNAQSWPGGTELARLFSGNDWNEIVDNDEDHEARVVALEGQAVPARITGTAGEAIPAKSIVRLHLSQQWFVASSEDEYGNGADPALAYAPDGIAQGSTGTLYLRALITGFSAGMPPGRIAYLADDGAINFSPGTYPRAIGFALNMTDLMFDPSIEFGNLRAPFSTTDNAILRADGTSGTRAQDSLVTVDDDGNLSLPSGAKYKINGVDLAAVDIGATDTDHDHSGGDGAQISHTALADLPGAFNLTWESAYEDLTAEPNTGYLTRKETLTVITLPLGPPAGTVVGLQAYFNWRVVTQTGAQIYGPRWEDSVTQLESSTYNDVLFLCYVSGGNWQVIAETIPVALQNHNHDAMYYPLAILAGGEEGDNRSTEAITAGQLVYSTGGGMWSIADHLNPTLMTAKIGIAMTSTTGGGQDISVKIGGLHVVEDLGATAGDLCYCTSNGDIAPYPWASTRAVATALGGDLILLDRFLPPTTAEHGETHQAGGADPLPLDSLDAPSDTTDLDVSTTAHGLAPKLPGDGYLYLNGNGGYSPPNRANYYEEAGNATLSLASGTRLILVNATAGTRTVTLPGAEASDGLPITIKKIDSSANGVTIAAGSGDTIDGAASKSLATQYASISLIAAYSDVLDDYLWLVI